MTNLFSKLDQAFKDLIEAYSELEEELAEKCGDDEEAYSHAVLEALETSIESAIEEHDSSTSAFANILGVVTEALEQLDPAAFEGEDSDYDLDEVEYEEGEIDDADIDDGDIDDADLDLDEDEIEVDEEEEDD